MGGTSRLGENSFLKPVVKCFERCFNVVIGSPWDIVAAFGCLEMATQGIVLGDQAVWTELVRLLGIVQE